MAGTRERGGEGTDQAQLAKQATLTPDQAQSAALVALPGTVQRTRLERDNSLLVYEVTVAPQSGGATQDVEIDAANGTVLKTQPSGQDQDDGDDD